MIIKLILINNIKWKLKNKNTIKYQMAYSKVHLEIKNAYWVIKMNLKWLDTKMTEY